MVENDAYSGRYARISGQTIKTGRFCLPATKLAIKGVFECLTDKLMCPDYC